MKTLILDFGSGETNDDISVIYNAIDKILDYKEMNQAPWVLHKTFNKIIVKFQLFNNTSVPGLKPLSKELFKKAFSRCVDRGIECTASVFDKESLDYLLGYDVKSVKIAAREWAYPLIVDIPDHIKIYCSVTDNDQKTMIAERFPTKNISFLNCVAKYPAEVREYIGTFGRDLSKSISDHTRSLFLYKMCQPEIYERHVCSYHDDRIPDRSSYASTIDELRMII